MPFDRLDEYFHVTAGPPHRYTDQPPERPPEEARNVVGMAPFFPVQPLPSLVSLDLLTNMARTADECAANVCLFPELVMRDDQLPDFVRFLNHTPFDELRLVVAGSVHLKVDEAARNRLHVFAVDPYGVAPEASAEPFSALTHDKVGTFWDRFGDQYLYEDIDRSHTLRVSLAGGKTVCFLICKDGLTRSVLETLHAVGCRYVIIAALSPKTEEFVAHLTSLAVTNNTVGLLACTTEAHGITAALACPTRHPTFLAARNDVVPAVGAGARPGPRLTVAAGVDLPAPPAAFGPFLEAPRRVHGPRLVLFTSHPQAQGAAAVSCEIIPEDGPVPLGPPP